MFTVTAILEGGRHAWEIVGFEKKKKRAANTHAVENSNTVLDFFRAMKESSIFNQEN